MNSSQALIVDDSKTAQHLLKRMLQKFNLKIDIVASAEEALTYLSYSHPAVIFLDEHMTGMSGIEVLKTIKANPHTALIPVIMYTSREDDLFVSQAIALGAQGIFSKSAMQPANLESVLSSLNIRAIGAGGVQEEAVADAEQHIPFLIANVAPAPVSQQSKEQLVPDLDQIRSQIGRLFEIHIADIKNQINHSTQFLVKRVAASNEKQSNALPREAVLGNSSLSAVKSVVKNAVGAERQKIAFASYSLFAVMMLAMGFFGYELLQIQSELEQASKNYQMAVEVKKREGSAAVTTTNLAGNEKKNEALLRAIGWVQNADFQFNYGEQPFNDLQLSNLNNLVYILADGGYKGPLVVDVNFGNVCLESSGANTWRLARNDLPATACKMLKDLNPKFSGTDYITLSYQNFEKAALPIQDGRINIRLVSSGISVPRIEYPLMGAATTAGEWNRAALRNNRVSVRFAN